MFKEELQIPKDRIAILIGKKGGVKREIEKITHTKIEIDSQEGDIFIWGEKSINVFRTKNVLLAIGRGFNPKIAKYLLDDQYKIEVISIKDFSRKSKKKFIRMKSRVIGTKGRAWKLIEQLTNTDISIYGKTVSIIGMLKNVDLARKAIHLLLLGSEHSNVYKWIERQKSFTKKFDDGNEFEY